MIWYFQKERQIRYKETLVLMAASLGNADLVTKMLREYESELFPEMAGLKKDFVNEGKKALKEFSGKAFKLSTTGDKAAMSVIGEEDVKGVFEDQTKALEQAQQELRERWFKKFGVYPKET